MNFPIFNKSYQPSSEELLKYLEIFPSHTIIYTAKHGKVYTYHRFKDDLLIQGTWLPVKGLSFLPIKKEFHSISLFSFLSKGELVWSDVRIVYHSDGEKSFRSDSSFLAYRSIICPENLTIGKRTYQHLEHDSSCKVTLPKSFFNRLAEYTKPY